MKKKLMCSLLVKNYDEAIDFYTKKLGWVVAEDNPMGDDRWVTITVPGNDRLRGGAARGESQGRPGIIGQARRQLPIFWDGDP